MIRTVAFAAALASSALIAAPAHAQTRPTVANPSPAAAAALNSSTQPDVLLDIPNLSVEQLTLEVDNLQAHIALDARLGNLLKLTAGADASIDKVKLDIKGVKAQATLIVRLDNVRAIIERTLQTIDKNPAIIQTLGSTVNSTVGTVGGVVNNTVSTVGNLTTGLLRSGAVLDLVNSGLSTVSSTVDSTGNTVRRLRASDGAVYEVVTDVTNKILRSTRVG
jgi:hypothetical protein